MVSPCDGQASHPGGVEILLVASCYRNWDKLWPDGPLDSYADNLPEYRHITITDSSHGLRETIIFKEVSLYVRSW